MNSGGIFFDGLFSVFMLANEFCVSGLICWVLHFGNGAALITEYWFGCVSATSFRLVRTALTQ